MNKELLKKVFMFGGASLAVEEAGIDQSTLLTEQEAYDLISACASIMNYPDNEAKKVAIETFQEMARDVIRLGKPQTKEMEAQKE